MAHANASHSCCKKKRRFQQGAGEAAKCLLAGSVNLNPESEEGFLRLRLGQIPP
jgi:hypothetical protein